MRRTTTEEEKQQVLKLRRDHSFKEVAELTGVSLNTVKAICRRSGLFDDNPQHRALFKLPEAVASTDTQAATVEAPPQQAVTGDKEIDAMLWLRECIKTGQPELMQKAIEAADRIKATPKELEDRYMVYLAAQGAGFTAAFKSVGFANLKSLAKSTTAEQLSKAEAAARFGNDPDLITEALKFCVQALDGVKDGKYSGFDDEATAKRFRGFTEYMPHTLSDCLYELAFWFDYDRIHTAATGGDLPPECWARESFTLDLLGEIRPRSKAEAMAVFDYVYSGHYSQGLEDAKPIFKNLLSI